MDQKSIKNRPKSRSGGVLEASWGVLEAFLGVLEVFWGVLGILEPSGGRLESILNRLGCLLAGLAPKKVASMGANKGQSSYLHIREDVVSYMAVRV